MSDKPLIINTKNLPEKEYKEIKCNEVLNFLMRYSKLKWDQGKKRTRQLFPSFEIISKNCHLDIEATKEIIYLLEEKGEIIRDVSQRYLRWVWEKVQIQKKKIEKQKLEKFLNINEKTEKQNNNKFKFNINDKIKLFILKSIMLIIAVIVFYISTYFTYLWFTSMFDNFKSLLLSFAIVGTSVTSFEIMLFFKQDKNIVGMIFFGILWVGVVTFSVSTGLSGQLNSEIQKKIKYEQMNLKDDNKILLYENYENRIKQLNVDINSIRKERDKLQQFLYNTNFDSTSDKKEYKNINYRITLKNNEINKLRNEINNLEIKKEELLQQDVKINVSKKIDFFSWMEKVLNISADKFRFILYLILALFVDIICPINFSIVLFYRRKE